MAQKLRDYEMVEEPEGDEGNLMAGEDNAVLSPALDMFDGGEADPMGHISAPAKSGETPRERQGGGGPISTPPMPRTPTMHTGVSSPGDMPSPTAPPPQLRSFTPMADVGMGGPVGGGGLFGSLGGLRGGGLGVPLDPMSNQQTGISELIKALLRGQ